MTGRLRRYLPAVAVFGSGIVLWELVVRGFDIQRFLLPPPSNIAGTLLDQWPRLSQAGINTLVEAVGGFVIGLAAGVLAALATARFAVVRGALMPFAIAANAVPIVAFAPIMNNWFGVTSPVSKMMIVAVLVFFPVMINTVRGLLSAEPTALEMMRSYAASEVQTFRKVRVPAALPFFFTALKVGTTLSLIGAIVGEYFGGSNLVLGRVIVESASFLRFSEAWAAIVIVSAMGIGFYLIILGIERLVMPWHASVRSSAP